MIKEIYNPFSKDIVNLNYFIIHNYKEEDKRVLEHILLTEKDEYRKIQLVEFLYRIYARKNTPMPKKSIEEKLDFLYNYIRRCFNNRYSIQEVPSEQAKHELLSFLAEAIVAERRILVGVKQRAK